MEKDVLPEENLKKLSNQYDGKLLLEKEISIPTPQFKSLLNRKYFKEIPSITHSKWQIRCLRCNNQTPYLFAKYPCLVCEIEHFYCRNCIKMGRVSSCEPLYEWSGPSFVYPKHKNPCSWGGELTSYQQAAANDIITAIEIGKKEHLIWAVCGSGKTEMLFPGITRALQLGKRICLATPRSDVVRELLPRLREAFHGILIEGLYGASEEKEGKAQIIVATTHQLLRYKEAFEVIVIDELDAFPYHADQSLPFATKRSLTRKGTMIYLTATPRKAEQRKIKRKKLPHTFVPIRYHKHPLPLPKFKTILQLSKQLYEKQNLKFLLSWFKKRQNKDRQVLIFVATIDLADRLIDLLSKLLLEEKIIKNKTEITSVHSKDSDRAEKVMGFREKKLKVLLTTTILERGVTFPSVDVLVLDAGHLVFDEAALVQIAGRAGRSAEDPDGEVVFFHDGKTKAMVEAKKMMESMNRRAGFI